MTTSQVSNIVNVLMSASVAYYSVYCFVSYFLSCFLSVDDILANIGSYQVFFTFFGALVVKNGLMNQIWSETIGALLVMANLAIVVYLIYYRWDTIMAYIHNETDAEGLVKTAGVPGEIISIDGAPLNVAEKEAAKAEANAEVEMESSNKV
jgi:hypothetical protein